MKHPGRIFRCSEAIVAGAALVLGIAPQMASAQDIGYGMRPGVVTQGTPQHSNGFVAPSQISPVPNAAPQYAPMRSGVIFVRPPQTYQSGPAVTVPDAGQTAPLPSGARYQFRQEFAPQRGYSSNNVVNAPQSSYPQSSYDDSDYRRSRQQRNINAPVGPANGFFNNSIPPIGPGNGFFNNLTPPVGPANGFPSTPASSRRPYRQNYIYTDTVNPVPIIAGGPSLLGGYYYGNYCDTPFTTYTYPSVYSVYSGFPQYLFQPNVIVAGQPYSPDYVTSYQPFYQPNYQVNYNNNYYYVANEDRARELESGGDQAQDALQNAYPASSFQAAFGDIARAWTDDDIKPLRQHIRDNDTRLSVFLNKKYSYSIASGDFVQITRDALDRLDTVSFEFTRIRKAKNGDVTAFGKHVYHLADAAANANDPNVGETVPFDQAGSDGQNLPYSQTNDPASGDEKTVYVSYTLRHRDDLWYIVALDSSAHDLVSADSQ